MKIKEQWIVFHGGYVLLVLTDDGYFAQTGLHFEFNKIHSLQAKKLIETYKTI